MKKVIVLSLIAILLSPGVALAQYPGMKPSKDQAEAFKVAIEMMLLYKFLGQPSMVAAGDDIFVLFGNKIAKYDRELNIVKEVTLGLDVTSTREMVSKLAGSYSEELMQKMTSAAGAGASNLMEAKLSANDALAKATLRSLSTASEAYATVNAGNYPASILDLTQATPPYLNTNYCEQEVSGFTFACEFSAAAYKFTATPTVVGGSGSTTYTITTGGVMQP